MSTHAQLGVKMPDNKIVGCYVHYDGDSMRSRIEDYLSKYTTTDLTLLIAQAQAGDKQAAKEAMEILKKMKDKRWRLMRQLSR